MKYCKFFLFLATALTLSGCPARSLNSLFTEEETVYNPALIGTWVSDDVIITFSKYGDKGYRAVYTDPSATDTLIYIVQLGKIGDQWFIDTFPADSPIDDHLVPAHMISKIWFDKNQMHLATLEADWLKKMIDANRLKIPHVRRGDEIILTASTPALQQLAAKFGENKEAFPPGKVPFKRK